MDSGNDFANFQQATKSGVKYEDENADGAFNGADAGLAGWTIAAYADNDDSGTLTAGDTLADSDVTDGAGAYSLTLDPGRYIIVEQVSDQSDWFESPDGATASVNTFDGDYGEFGYDITLTSGDVDSGNDFANFQPIDISGLKFYDHDGDGVKDGTDDEPLAGWTIFLDDDADGVLDWTDAGGFNGVWDEGEGERWTVTLGDGTYSFTDLRPGVTYHVIELLQTDFVQTSPIHNSDPRPTYQVFPGGQIVTGYAITTQSGQDETGLDFGNRVIRDISGRKFEDVNGDGDPDAGELGLAGWTIELYLDANDDDIPQPSELIATDVTSAGGAFSFADLDASQKYILKEVLQNGWIQTMPDPGIGGGVYIIPVDSGDVIREFGNFREGSIHGIKFEDINWNETWDSATEPLLGGWTIFLDDNADGVLDWTDAGGFNGVWDEGEGERWTTTSSDSATLGEYWFVGLGPGVYSVREVVRTDEDWQQTTDDPVDITLQSGQEYVALAGQADPLGQDQTEVVQGDLAFGNARVVADPHTLGFWSNQNGRALIRNSDLQVLRDLNLRNADGTDFDPQNRHDLRQWLLGANASNMVYMLSAQLAAMQLNVLHGFVSTGALVSITRPGGSVEAIEIGDLMDEANAALADPGAFTKAELGSLKTALDDANNGLTFLFGGTPITTLAPEVDIDLWLQTSAIAV